MRKDTTRGGTALSRRSVLSASAGAATALAMPSISYGQTGTIKIGVPTILSGRVALVGVSSTGGMRTVFDKFNAAGGLNGRKIELVVRDSKGAPQEAAKVTRDLINNEGCHLIIDARRRRARSRCRR